MAGPGRNPRVEWIGSQELSLQVQWVGSTPLGLSLLKPPECKGVTRHTLNVSCVPVVSIVESYRTTPVCQLLPNKNCQMPVKCPRTPV